MIRTAIALVVAACGLVALPLAAQAQPVVTPAQPVDVTDRSFALVWKTDVPATGTVHLYADPDGLTPVVPRVGLSGGDFTDPSTLLGVLRVRAAGLDAQTVVYYQTETTALAGGSTFDPPAAPFPAVALYNAIYPVLEQDYLTPETSDVIAVQVEGQGNALPVPGALVLMTTPRAQYPISAQTTMTSTGSHALLDLNNFFDARTRETLFALDGADLQITVEAGTLGSTTDAGQVPTRSGRGIAHSDTFATQQLVPEPGALPLLLAGVALLGGLGVMRRSGWGWRQPRP